MSTTTEMLRPHVQVITCDNPSPMTLEGTNTYLLGAEDSAEVAVVDPGPDGHPQHLAAIIEAAGRRRISLILLTHRHQDHSGSSAALSQRTRAAVRAFDPELCVDAEPLSDGEGVSAGGVEIVVRHTPGHTSDSVSFWLPGLRAMITGDTVLGRGTTMLDHPDGTLTDYFASLDLLTEYDRAALLPAHGPIGAPLVSVVRAYRRHREDRLDQAKQLLDEHGSLSAAQLGKLIYGSDSAVSEAVVTKIAAAQLDHLRRRDERCPR